MQATLEIHLFVCFKCYSALIQACVSEVSFLIPPNGVFHSLSDLCAIGKTEFQLIDMGNNLNETLCIKKSQI